VVPDGACVAGFRDSSGRRGGFVATADEKSHKIAA
jgi:hypothetical protein